MITDVAMISTTGPSQELIECKLLLPINQWHKLLAAAKIDGECVGPLTRGWISQKFGTFTSDPIIISDCCLRELTLSSFNLKAILWIELWTAIPFTFR